MATRHHNVTGELTKQLLAPGDSVNVTSISLANVDSSTTTVNSVVDLYIEKQLAGKFYLLKGVNIPVGSTLVLEKEDVNFNNGVGQFGLFIKLTKGTTFTLTGSINPTASTTVTGSGTKFLTELSVGDEIVVSSETRIVSAIASDTSLTVSVATTNTANDTSPDCNPVAPVDVIIS
tara:strand:+ start:606 stop:1133 length:528 start_codon:yes stop_codon:yes gene_type:complete